MEPEREFMGRKKAKLWTYLIFGTLLVLGVLIFLLGLRIETDWPEALGALLIAGSVAWGELLIGWDRFVVAGLAVTPYVIPVVTFLVLLTVGMVKSR